MAAGEDERKRCRTVESPFQQCGPQLLRSQESGVRSQVAQGLCCGPCTLSRCGKTHSLAVPPLVLHSAVREVVSIAHHEYLAVM